ncbi:hypothetical protein PQX77_009767 [Marasmius sp. AFHP31]|nr:hypothetical protein PQX77_009767 [Marasmius sp. AFHP31]
MLSRFFHKARNFQITGGSFNHVQGDQHNHNYTTTIVQAKEEEPSEFDEYFKVKLGGIFKLRDVGSSAYPRRWDDGRREWGEEGKPRSDKTICTARVLEQPGMAFTMLQYSGPDAHRAFLEDFQMLSNTLTSNASQIYGYSKSSIPSLLLYNDLAPASQLEGKLEDLGIMYLCSLAAQLGCKDPGELWIDTGRGTICRGPPGPGFEMPYISERYFGESDVPLTADLLQSDVLLRFAASLKSKKVDRYVIEFASISSSANASVLVSQPTVISKLTNTPIAVANNVWESIYSNLSDRKVLGDGLTRFTLAHDSGSLSLCWNAMTEHAWMLQAWRVFHNRGITLEDDLSIYPLCDPLKPNSSNDPNNQSTYLFVHLLPTSIAIITKLLPFITGPFTKTAALLSHPIPVAASAFPSSLSMTTPVTRSLGPTKNTNAYTNINSSADSTLPLPILLVISDAIITFFKYPSESKPSTPASDILGEFEDLAPVEQATTSESSGTRLGSTSSWSSMFLPSATEVSSELVTTVDTPDVDVDWHLV